jgi:hypothetical protein
LEQAGFGKRPGDVILDGSTLLTVLSVVEGNAPNDLRLFSTR